jgi:peptidyl-prolyl cis-trans isomerase SurA
MRTAHWLLAMMLATLGLAAMAADARPEEADRIVAVVNSEVITLFELRSRLAQVERQFAQQKIASPPQDVLQRQMLERMITDRAQLQYAQENGIRVEDAQVDKALDRISESNQLPLSQFRAALEKDGIAWEKFRSEIRDEIALVRLREREVDNRVMVSEAEIDNYLVSPARAEGAEELLVRHILIRIPEQTSPERLAKLRARADEALSQVKLGTDFGQVAAGYSDAPDALTGGSLDWRAADRLPALFAEAAGKLQPGQASEVLRSAAGFHIVKLDERRGGAVAGKPVEQTSARHILIKPTEILSDDEARHKLDLLKDRLDHGGDFAELARLHSNDISASKGGDLGWLYPGDTVPEFERAMNTLKPGEIGAPVRTPFGWHLIQVLERRVQDASAERQRLVARQAIRERKADEAYQDWVRQLRDRAYVEIRLEEK